MPTRPRSRSRRTFLTLAAHVGVAGGLAGPAVRLLVSPASAQAPADGAPVASRTTLVLLGTQGGPSVNLGRGQAANAVVVDGHPYLVDCGYGTLRALAQARIPFTDVETVFLTHLHDDHTIDLAALLSHKWTGGSTQPAAVYGPHGTRALVEAAVGYLRANADVRAVDEGRPVRPEALFRGHDAPAGSTPVDVLRDARVRVTASENTHFPERARARMPYRSLAYRFDTVDRSIVFSGDTAYSEALIALARNADLFVCEAIDVATYRQLERAAEVAEAQTGNRDSIPRHIVETHSTTEDVGRMAAAAGVKTVVLTHLVPGSNPQRGVELPDTAYIDAVRKHFNGQVFVGRDQMRL